MTATSYFHSLVVSHLPYIVIKQTNSLLLFRERSLFVFLVTRSTQLKPCENNVYFLMLKQVEETVITGTVLNG